MNYFESEAKVSEASRSRIRKEFDDCKAEGENTSLNYG